MSEEKKSNPCKDELDKLTKNEWKFFTEEYTKQIDWNLNLQLSWLGLAIASFIGLFEMIGNINDPSCLLFLIYSILDGAVVFSVYQVIFKIQTLARKKFKRMALIGKREITVPNDPSSDIQKIFLQNIEECPTLRKRWVHFGLLIVFLALLSVYFIKYEITL